MLIIYIWALYHQANGELTPNSGGVHQKSAEAGWGTRKRGSAITLRSDRGLWGCEEAISGERMLLYCFGDTDYYRICRLQLFSRVSWAACEKAITMISHHHFNQNFYAKNEKVWETTKKGLNKIQKTIIFELLSIIFWKMCLFFFHLY